jgi:hypothetical protein
MLAFLYQRKRLKSCGIVRSAAKTSDRMRFQDIMNVTANENANRFRNHFSFLIHAVKCAINRLNQTAVIVAFSFAILARIRAVLKSFTSHASVKSQASRRFDALNVNGRVTRNARKFSHAEFIRAKMFVMTFVHHARKWVKESAIVAIKPKKFVAIKRHGAAKKSVKRNFHAIFTFAIENVIQKTAEIARLVWVELAFAGNKLLLLRVVKIPWLSHVVTLAGNYWLVEVIDAYWDAIKASVEHAR